MALDLQPLGEPAGSSSSGLDLQPLQPSLDEGYGKMWSKAKEELHGIEDATNRVVGGGLGFMGALLPTAAHRLNEHIQGRGDVGSFDTDFSNLSQKISEGLVPATKQLAPDAAEKYNDFAADFFNRVGFASIGVHGTVPYAKNMPKTAEGVGKVGKFEALDKINTTPKSLDLQPLEVGKKVEDIPPEVRAAQETLNAQDAGGNATFLKQPEAIDYTNQRELPFTNENLPNKQELQGDLFGDQRPLETPERPAIPPDFSRAQSDANRMGDLFTEQEAGAKALETKRAEIEQMYQERVRSAMADKDRQAFEEAKAQRDSELQQLEQKLREDAYVPGQGRKLTIPRSERGSAPFINDLADLIIKRTSNGLEAYRGEKKVGYLKSNLTPEQSKALGENANVDIVKADKGQGIGAALYKTWAEDHEGRIAPSGKTTQDAWNVWKRDFPEKVQDFVTQEATRLHDGAPRSVVLENITDPSIRKQVVEASSIRAPKSQQGSAPIINEAAKVVQQAIDLGTSIAKVGLHHLTSKEDYISKNIPGMSKSLADRITEPPKAETIVKDAMDPKVQDIPKQGIISKNVQSGLQQMSTKYRDHPLLLGVGRVLDNMHTKTEYQVKQVVTPLMEHINLLPRSEQIELSKLWTKEMFDKKQWSKEQLIEAGFSKKQVDAYEMFRAAQEGALKMNNAGRALLGKDPITRENAYLASIRQGDWQFSVLDKHGKAAWFVRASTKVEALAAIDHLKKNFGDTLQLKKVAPEFRKDSSKYNPDTPRDVMGAYQDMLKAFADNPELSSAIKESMTQFAEQKGYDFAGHKQRFMDKQHVRGFEGDKPWLSDKENSVALMKAQENYLKNTIGWNHAQEAMANVKEILSNEELITKMPNAMDMVKSVVDGQFGMNHAVTASVENVIAQMLPAIHGRNVALGRSSASLYRGAGGIKTALYLQLLGLNLTHMIATPIQGIITAPRNHRYLTVRGFEHNVFKTTMLAIGDFAAGMAKHTAFDMVGKDLNLPMSDVGKRALQFAEDNGVINKNLFNESVDLGSGPIRQNLKSLGGFSIALPEKVTRLATFMSLTHHLMASGKLSEMEAFQKAKEFTDNSLTGFGRQDRPMVVNKAGAAGSLAYTFKSYLFNYFNQLSTDVRLALPNKLGGEGTISPLAYNLGMLAVVGGALSLPMINEADGTWNVFKDFISTHKPEAYKYVKGRGVKESMIANLPDWAAYGLASTITGIGLQNKFGTDITDPEHPMKNVFPMAQDIKEAVAGVGAMSHPNKTTVTEAVYQQMPKLIQGQMEHHMDAFKGPQQAGGQIAYNPNKLSSPTPIDHLRTPSDLTLRSVGMTSLGESKDRQTGYMNVQEDMRKKDAVEKLGEHVFDAAYTRKNVEDTKAEIKSYLELNPDGNALKQDFSQRINKAVLTPSQRNLIQARTYAQIDSVLRLMGTRGQRAN